MAGLEGKSAEEIESLASLADSLASNPKTRLGFLQLTKHANPDASIPEIDIPNRIEGLVKPYVDRIAKMEADTIERETRERIESHRRELGVSKDELAKIEKVMVEKGIANHATAKEFIDRENRMAESTPAPTGRSFRTFGRPELPKLEPGTDLRGYARNTAYSVIDELKGRKSA